MLGLHTKGEVYPPMAGQNAENRIQNVEQFSVLTPRLCSGQASDL